MGALDAVVLEGLAAQDDLDAGLLSGCLVGDVFQCPLELGADPGPVRLAGAGEPARAATSWVDQCSRLPKTGWLSTPASRRFSFRFPVRDCAYTDTTASVVALPARAIVLMSRSAARVRGVPVGQVRLQPGADLVRDRGHAAAHRRGEFPGQVVLPGAAQPDRGRLQLGRHVRHQVPMPPQDCVPQDRPGGVPGGFEVDRAAD